MKQRHLKRTARRNDGTVYQTAGAAKTTARKFSAHKDKLLGKMGAASKVRRIDPITGEVIETLNMRGEVKIKSDAAKEIPEPIQLLKQADKIIRRGGRQKKNRAKPEFRSAAQRDKAREEASREFYRKHREAQIEGARKLEAIRAGKPADDLHA